MAKKQSRPADPNTTRFSIQAYNTAHFRTTEAYAAMIDVLFDRATDAITKAAARGEYDPDKPFSFDDYPELKKKMQEVLVQLTSRMTTVIETGTKQEWLFAVKKNDAFLASIMDTSKLTKAQLAQLQDRNLDGLKAFQERKGKMGLSKEVWKIGTQYQDQIQDALDVGLGDGRSAQALARDVKQNLKHPDKLFRRVRDKHGNLRLSKAAAAYHPGQGVYRSAVKNAQRLTRTEINMAYRESDYQRWQQLDFVVGFEVFRSNHDPLCKCKVCEKLVGRYPKNFKFVGWHPQCMCYAVPILMDEETFDENELGDLKAALRGTEYKKKQAKNLVTTLPDGFNEWTAQNAEKQKGWKSTPYFIRDNFKNGSLADGLNDNIFQLQSTIEADVAAKVEAFRAWGELSKDEQKKYTDLRKSNLYELPKDLRDACDEYGISYAHYDDLYWDLYDATKPKTDMLGNVIDYPDYHKWNEAIQERQRIEQTLAAKIQDAKVKARQVIEDFKRRFEDARIWLKLDVAVIQSVEDSWNIIVSDKYPVFTSVFNSLSLKTDYTARIDTVRKELDKAQKDAQALIAKGQGDLSEVKRLVALSPTPTCPAETIVEDLKKAIARVTNPNPHLPADLNPGCKHLNGEDYEFDRDFFDLVGSLKNPVKLEILESDSGSYSSWYGDLVHIASHRRGKASPWEAKAVIYHEYGHCIDAQRDLWKDKALIDMRNKQIKWLKGKPGKGEPKSLWVKEYDYSAGKSVWVEKTFSSRVAYIDAKLKQYISIFFNMKEETFKRYGITRMDAIEAIGSTRDTIKSLVISYGDGHSTKYFRQTRMKETEYLAHCFENAFLGNRIFQKLMPDIYNEMCAYIRALKP